MATLSSGTATCVALLLLFNLFLVNAQLDGLSAELIHRDSPKSPFHNPNLTLYERISNAYHRSLSRFTVNDGAIGSPSADISPSISEYVMKISVGTPSVEFQGLADTASNIIWMQCKPSNNCYRQIAPTFGPEASSTYKEVPCGSSRCQMLENHECQNKESPCTYLIMYADGTYSIGSLATDMVTLGSTTGQLVQLPDITIGCGHNNSEMLMGSVQGVIGMGWGPTSLVSQMGESIQGLFAYCLVRMDFTERPSKINFGSNAIVSGSRVVSNPLFKKGNLNFYFLNLEAISVNGNRVETSGTSLDEPKGNGNIMIDSGTTFTLLPRDFYTRLEEAVALAAEGERASEPSSRFSLCYRISDSLIVPNITMHFSWADLSLTSLNTFIEAYKGIACLAFIPNEVGPAVYGNIAQINFLVGYDTFSQKVSFMPTDCAALY